MKTALLQLLKWGSMIPRRLSGSVRLLPDYLVIGTQKGGTTSLYYYLIGHPHVAAALEEEIHFFDINFGRGPGWYQAHFPLRASRTLARYLHMREFKVGESTPYYLFHPHAPRRVHATVPSAKLVVLLRNPIDRAYSHYQHSLRRGRDPLSFEEALRVERERLAPELVRMGEDESYYSFSHQHHSYLVRGLYLDQLKSWRALFLEQQIGVFSAEDFATDTSRVFAEILHFLELPPWEPRVFPKHNAWRYPQMDPATRRYLVDYFRPHNERLYEYLGREFDWNR